MRQFFLLLVCLFCMGIAQQASAQLKGFSFGPYGEIAFPTGSFRDNFNNGFGVGGQADIRLLKGWAATGSIGYLYFRGKDIVDSAGTHKVPNLLAAPIRIGLKYRPLPSLYFKLEAGSVKLTAKNYRSADFILSPGVGLKVLGFDFQAKYEAWIKNGTKGFWGLKAGWGF